MQVQQRTTQNSSVIEVGYPGAKKSLVITVATRVSPVSPWIPDGRITMVGGGRNG